jgi:hypothetical protein
MVKSKSGEMNRADYRAWGMNFIKFVAPTLAVFFGQLALGVEWKVASLVALLAFYQSAADFFGKLSAGK